MLKQFIDNGLVGAIAKFIISNLLIQLSIKEQDWESAHSSVSLYLGRVTRLPEKLGTVPNYKHLSSLYWSLWNTFLVSPCGWLCIGCCSLLLTWTLAVVDFLAVQYTHVLAISWVCKDLCQPKLTVSFVACSSSVPKVIFTVCPI